MDSLLRAAFPVFAAALMAIAGCTGQPATDGASISKFRAQFTLAKEPADVRSVSEVRTALSGEAPPNVLALLEDEHEHAEGETGDGEADEAAAEHADHVHGDEAADHDDHDADGDDHPPGDHPESMDVALVGVVGGVPNPMDQTVAEFPFAKGQAMFFVADPDAVAELQEHGHQHAAGEECAFCAAHAADAKALIAAVTFLDDHGKPLAIDARDLFGLKGAETVVVRGTAKMAAGGILSVEATGLFVRK